MKSIFWIFWGLDLLLGLFTVLSKNFRRSFTSSDPTVWFGIATWVCLILGLILVLGFKRTLPGLIVAAIPWVILLIWWLVDRQSA